MFLVNLCILLAYCSISLQDFVALPPSIVSGPQPGVIYFTQSGLRMHCFATGQPFPSITWYKDGEPLNTNQDHVTLTNHSQAVRIVPASTESSSSSLSCEGSYHCMAENPYGVVVSNATRYVRAEHARKGDDLTRHMKAKQGRHFLVTMFDRLSSVPQGPVVWQIAETVPVNLDKRIQIDDNGDLHFAYVVPEDARDGDIYKARSYNLPMDSYLGSSYSKIEVEEALMEGIAPHLAFHSPHHVIALEGQNFTLKCFFAGFPLPDVEWAGPNRALPAGRHVRVDHSRILIVNATSSDAGVYRCTGRSSAGESTHSMSVGVEAFPRFLSESDAPSKSEVSEGDDVTLRCSGYGDPPPSHQWIVDGQPISPHRLPRKMSLSGDGKTLTVRRLCKVCPDGGHDMRVVQCNVSNRHGYLLASGYINVLTRTKAHLSGNNPLETVMDEEERTLTYQCSATSDPSTPVTILWQRRVSQPSYSLLQGSYFEKEEYETLPRESHNIVVGEFGKLVLSRKRRDSATWTSIGTKFKCLVNNSHSTDVKFVELHIPDSPVAMKKGLVSWWWVLVLLIVLIAAIIALIVLCRKIIKQKGNEYNVDAREKSSGHEPEKELMNHGFRAYKRPDACANYLKDGNTSVGSSGPCSDEDESLDDYCFAEGGKFNEDGSFVGAYTSGTNNSKMANKVKKEYIGSPLTRYYT